MTRYTPYCQQTNRSSDQISDNPLSCNTRSTRNLRSSAITTPRYRRSGLHQYLCSVNRRSDGTPSNVCSPRFGQHFAPLNPITHVEIVIDQGSSFTEAAWLVIHRSDHERAPAIKALRDRNLLGNRVSDVSWQRRRTQCPTQIAFRHSDQSCQQPLFGDEVDLELLNSSKDVDNACVLRFLKPRMYDTDASSSWHDNELLKKLRTMPQFLGQNNASRNGSDHRVETEPDGMGARTVQEKDIVTKLWTLYLEYAFLYVINKIWKEHNKDLPWTPPPLGEEYTKVDSAIFGSCIVETAITVPAAATVTDVQLALDCAQEAGLPNCIPIFEPTAAAAWTVQRSFEKAPEDFERYQTDAITNACAIGDLGGGTFDVIVFGVSIDKATGKSVAKELRLSELIPGDSSWCGAATINKEFHRLLQIELDINQIVAELNRSTDRRWTYTIFLDHCELLFEQAKKTFSMKHVEQAIVTPLNFPELEKVRRYRPSSRLVLLRPGAICLSSEFMELVFKPCVTGVVRLLKDQLRHFSVSNLAQRSSYTGPHRYVRNVHFVGGGAENAYISSVVRRECPTIEQGYRVSISEQASFNESSLMVCKGALLLLADREFLAETVLRRGYCFSMHDFGKKANDRPGFRCNVTGEWRLEDSGHWLCKGNEVFKGKVERKIRAERALHTECFDRDEVGWDIEEMLWASDRPEDWKQGIWVKDDRNGVFEIGRIAFRLPYDEIKDVATERDREGRELRWIEYESGLVLDRHHIRWFLRIPRSGTFSNVEAGFVPIEDGRLIDCRSNFRSYQRVCGAAY